MPWMKTACFVIVLARFFVMTRASHGRLTNINACLFQLFLQLFAEQVVVHLGRVARAFVELQVGILHFMADSGLDVCRAFITARDFGAGQLRLVVRQGPDTTHWLEQTNEVQVVVVGMHHPAIEGHPVHIPEVDKGFVKEREADPEAGAGADDVERLSPAVHKLHFIAMQCFNGRTGMDTAMADVIQQVRVQRRVMTQGRSEERRVGKECRSRWSPYHKKKKKYAGDE